MGLPGQTGVRPSPLAPFGPHAQKPASTESWHLGLLFFKITLGPFFLWLLNNREFPACISLEFFPLPIVCFCDSFLPKSAFLCSATRPGVPVVWCHARCYLVLSVL